MEYTLAFFLVLRRPLHIDAEDHNTVAAVLSTQVHLREFGFPPLGPGPSALLGTEFLEEAEMSARKGSIISR